MRRLVAASLSISMTLTGCAEMTHLTRKRAIGYNDVLLIDAKQRALHTQGRVFCAEPSPDALSALAASQGANFGTSSGTSAAETFMIAESAGSIGLRTQSIQLLRDHMYRVCEAYQAGQISPVMVELLHRRFQTTTIAILAIEQLTGAMRAPTIVLGGSATSGNAEAIAKLTALRESQVAQIAQAETELKAKESAAAKAREDVATKQAAYDTADQAGKAAAKSALDSAQAAAEKAEGERLTADGNLAGRRAALAATDRSMAMAQATGSVSAGGTIETTSYSPGDVQAVAGAVSTIVTNAFDTGNTKDFCTVALSQSLQGRINEQSPVFQTCLQLLAQGNMIR